MTVRPQSAGDFARGRGEHTGGAFRQLLNRWSRSTSAAPSTPWRGWLVNLLVGNHGQTLALERARWTRPPCAAHARTRSIGRPAACPIRLPGPHRPCRTSCPTSPRNVATLASVTTPLGVVAGRGSQAHGQTHRSGLRHQWSAWARGRARRPRTRARLGSAGIHTRQPAASRTGSWPETRYRHRRRRTSTFRRA
jgi:hypothetical protein